ncbi:MAG: vitamin K epoxide reductase family protein [Candidatus Babeliales bacterium]
MLCVIALLAVLGLSISLYSFWVDRKLLHDATYKPMCDLSDKVSCSKPFSTPYSEVLGISNTVISIIFYTSMFWLAMGCFSRSLFLGALISVVASIYLAYLLFFKIKSLCLICVSLYIVNILLLIATYYNLYY